MNDTLVTDTGEDIVGIYFVCKNTYYAYRGDKIPAALALLTKADEVVTYNGNHYDLEQLRKFAGLPNDHAFQLNGVHTDMREIIWSKRIWGKCLTDTFFEHFTEVPGFPDSYEGRNERDCYMTFKLWELWKKGKLSTLDGHSA